MGSADAVRFSYLRLPVLEDLLADDRVVDALVYQLETPGQAVALTGLSREEKLAIVERQVRDFTKNSVSLWHGVHPAEVIAASIWRTGKLSDAVRAKAFSAVKSAGDLVGPVLAHLKSLGFELHDDAPAGAWRLDLYGSRPGSFWSKGGTIAIEFENDPLELARSLEQLKLYRGYADRFSFACTPAVAADYVKRFVEARKVKHWEPDALSRQLGERKAGLLVVEGEQVFEVHSSGRAPPVEASKLEALERALAERPKL